MSEERKHDGGTIERLMDSVEAAFQAGAAGKPNDAPKPLSAAMAAAVDCIREVRDGENGPSCHLCGAMMVRVGVNEGVQAFKCLSCGATTGISIPTLRSASLAKDGAPAAEALSPKLEAKTAAIGVGEGIGRGSQLELPPPSEIYRQARAEGFAGDFYLSVCCGRELLSNSVTRFCPMCGRELRGDSYKPEAVSPKLEAEASALRADGYAPSDTQPSAAKAKPTAEDLDAVAAEQAAGEATR